MQRHTLAIFWHTARRYPVRLAVSLIVPITTVTVGAFIGPWFIAQFFDRLQAGQVSAEGLWPVVIGYVLTQLYGEVLGWRVTLYAVWRLELSVMSDLHRRTVGHLLGQSLTFHNNRFGGSLVSQTSKFAHSFERFFDMVVWELLPAVTSIVAATVILSFLFWQYAVVLFVLSVAFITAVVVSSRFMAPLTTAEVQATTNITARLADLTTNISAVKSFAREQDELDGYTGLVQEWSDRSRVLMRAYLGATTAYSTLLLSLNSAALIAAALAVQQQAIAAGTVYLAFAYTSTVGAQLWTFNQIVRNYTRAMGDAYDMTEILQIAPSVTDPRIPAPTRPSAGAIEIDSVDFRHEEAGETLFEGFSLSIAPGEHLGLVGSSGSGKTTLTRLLLRFADVDAGAIRIDGQNIASLSQADLRRAVAYVPQEPLLFHRSLRDNIAYGNPHATEDDVIVAARKAHAWEFVATLPNGLDTVVGERGVKLSGGQRQRIAIARAILKNAPILVLDEATSALDSESEALIQQALVEAMAGRTTIVIAHRLSTIRRLHRIVVLDGGRIVEQGTHEDLVRQGGAYARLWSHQSGGFLAEGSEAGQHSLRAGRAPVSCATATS